MTMLILTGVTRSIFRSARGVSMMHANSAFVYERTTPPLRVASLARRVGPSGKDINAQHTPLRVYSYLCPSQKALRDISLCVKSLKAKSPKAPQFLRSQRPFKRFKSQSASLRSATKAKDKSFKVKGASVPSAR